LAAASPLGVSTAAAQVATDTPAKSEAGIAYLVPAGWTATVEGNRVVLKPAESDTAVALVDVGEAADAKAAAAAAWATWRPDMKRKIEVATDRPGRNGWDAATVINYETSPNEHRSLFAVARSVGGKWSVMLVDGSEATMEKRGGSMSQLAAAWRPASFARENFAGKAANDLDPARVRELVEFVRQGAAALEVPGVGLALYDNGKVIYEGGVGVRELGKTDPVDAHTRFLIASNTKSMATLLLAKLVDQGKLRWDQKVVEVYPSFRLGDDATTAATEIRHLVCACTGLPRKDMEWLFATDEKTPATDTFRQLAATQPTSKFGEAFQYNNLMASAAGYIAGHMFYPDMELGAAFDRAVKEQITDPIGMPDTGFDFGTFLAQDHATPHGDDMDGRLHIIGQTLNRQIVPFRPAGGAFSSPHDMIRYIATELNEGVTPDGTRLVGTEALMARRAHNVPIGEDRWYGMGLMDDRSLGVSIISHGGDLAGYHSNMFAIPDAGVAAVILTNSDRGVYLRGPFQRKLMEVLYDGRDEAAGDLAATVKRIAAEREEFRKKLTIPGDPAAIAALASNYTNRDLGNLTIDRSGADPVIKAEKFTSVIGTKKNDDGTVSVVTIEPEFAGIEWVVGEDAGKKTLTLRDGQHVYVFTEG
jgi:CubicO group peptidase (beta-lactamase class C family)